MKSLIIYTVFLIGLLIGEIACIYRACTCNWEPVGKAEIVYTVAACTGLGGIVGYIDIKDK